MTDPLTIDKSERIAHALDLMEKHRLRRLLVTSNGKLGGIITMRQITRVLGTRQRLGLPASSLHVTSATLDAVIKVLPEMEVEDATLLLQKTSVLVVTEKDDIMGWIRPREVLAVTRMDGVAADVDQRRRADAVQFASCQHRLQHVGGIHCAFCSACPHHCVQFVDEQDCRSL